MKKYLTILLAILMVFSLVGCSQKQEQQQEEPTEETGANEEKAPEDYTGTLTIYSPHDQDPLDAGVKAFEEKYPNVTVEIVADGTSNLVAKIAAESANPVADVLWGGGADTLAAYKQYFQPYKPSCIDLLDPLL